MVRLCCEGERALEIENSELAQYTNHDVVIQKRKCKQIIFIMIFEITFLMLCSQKR